MVPGVVVVMMVMMTAGESRHSYHDHGDEQQRQKLFHGPDYSRAFVGGRSA